MIASIFQPHTIDERIKREIIDCKELFIEKNVSPLTNEYMRREVAESWVRSKNYGLLPDKDAFAPKISAEKLAQVKEDNHILMKIVQPIFETFERMAAITDYTLTLHDKNCVNLMQQGNFDTFGFFDDYVGQGHIFSEEFFGTSVLNLAMSYGKPVQIVGPEHYFIIMTDHISSAAPIYDQNLSLLGCICLIAKKQDSLWTLETYLIQASALGWVSALALAVMNEYHLYQKNRALLKANDTFDITLSLLEEGVLTVDWEGRITEANKTSCSILGQTNNEIKGQYLKNFLNPDSSLHAQITQGIQINHVEDVIITQHNKTSCYFRVRPILDKQTRQYEGAVIFMDSAKKYQNYIAAHGSFYANHTFDSIIGQSNAIEKVKKRAQRYASLKENILLIGKSGTGKELFAQSIHNVTRPNGPFVAVNCGALPRSLIESELFGYEGGAFTGAERNGKIGKIEMANGGTLFLDEIGEMPLDMQAVMLRVLDNKYVTRIGGNKTKYVDFRLLAATNQNLSEMVADKLFREDLFYRLSALTLKIPPICEREDDVLILAEYFLKRYCFKMNREPVKLSLSAIKLLKEYDWPGNVRQLENAVLSALVDCQGNMIEAYDFPEDVRNPQMMEKPTEKMSLRELEEMSIRRLLKETNNDVSKVAESLGIGQSTLYKRLKSYNINVRKGDEPC